MQEPANTMEDPDIETLLERYRNGDTSALGALVDSTRRPLFRFIYGMVSSVDLAEEVFQDVWLRAIRNLHRYQHDRIIAWLFQIARNRVIDLSRKKKPDVSLQQPLGEENGATLLDLVADHRPAPARQAGNRDLADRIRRAVADLPEEQREVFLLRTEADLAFKDIARLQKVSINTALARMQYALKRLREALQADYAELQTLGVGT